MRARGNQNPIPARQERNLPQREPPPVTAAAQGLQLFNAAGPGFVDGEAVVSPDRHPKAGTAPEVGRELGGDLQSQGLAGPEALASGPRTVL